MSEYKSFGEQEPPKEGWYWLDFGDDENVFVFSRYSPPENDHEDGDCLWLWGWDEQDDPESLALENPEWQQIKWKEQKNE